MKSTRTLLLLSFTIETQKIAKEKLIKKKNRNVDTIPTIKQQPEYQTHTYVNGWSTCNKDSKNLPTMNKIVNSNNFIVSHMLNEVKNLVWNTITSNGYLGEACARLCNQNLVKIFHWPICFRIPPQILQNALCRFWNISKQ